MLLAITLGLVHGYLHCCFSVASPAVGLSVHPLRDRHLGTQNSLQSWFGPAWAPLHPLLQLAFGPPSLPAHPERLG
jgi:hypothetical protein